MGYSKERERHTKRKIERVKSNKFRLSELSVEISRIYIYIYMTTRNEKSDRWIHKERIFI